MTLRSMTAFACAEQALGDWIFLWEIRSVNHRYLDLSIRLPEPLRFMEVDVRALVASAVRRGRLEVSLTLKPNVAAEINVIEFDPAGVTALLMAAHQIQELSRHTLAPFSAFDVLRWPGILKERDLDRDRLLGDALIVLEAALGKLVSARETEGRQLREFVEARLGAIRTQVATVRARLPSVLQAIRDKIASRLVEAALKPDAERLEQEMVYLAQKMDVTEELDRLEAHVDEMLRTLGLEEPVGRKLDFLSQEMNREANTLSSKSADLQTTRAAVEIKVLVEQNREQIQNIE